LSDRLDDSFTADLGLVDRAAAARTPAEAFYDNSFVDEMKKTGFLRELWK
jgi:hypothetical protein